MQSPQHQQLKAATPQYIHHEPHNSQATPRPVQPPPPPHSTASPRSQQFYPMSPQGQARPSWVTVRQQQPGMVRVVKPGPVQVQQPQRQIQVPQVQVQQQSVKPG